ncbi:rhodanese domain-containing protein [Psychromonas sp. CNPT3]|uniref:rhodanese-like domain-containing protein n=1 Tax=Psychromonas sp. CNPT3 TaxID=314282 RepID=UPI00006E38E7|nr:rhodanese-like domain-containing protein [Psychromonas sp. CNPT3]AGH82230.1 rhodanese domain-containing protein [Psychromonas sp. CNPT3]
MQEYIDFFSRNMMLSVAWLAIAGMFLHHVFKEKFSGFKNIDRQDATLLINKENAIVVDVREPADYKKGHIVHAKNITQSQIDDGKLSMIESHKQTPIIVVCDSGLRSKASAIKLAKAGFTNVNNLDEGMSGWVSENLPVIRK